MKFRFQGIDGGGRVVRGILRAGDEAEAREMLLSEQVFPKNLDATGEEEQVTWVSKSWVKEQHTRARASGDAKASMPPGSPVAAAVLDDGTEVVSGRFAAGEEGVYFETGGVVREWRADGVETARLAGFPGRRLMVSLLDGSLLEFRAGFVFAPAAFKSAVALLGRRRK